MTAQEKIYVAGHRGMVGAAIVRELGRRGHTNLMLRTHAELDLTNQAAVRAVFAAERPDQVYLAAARVGGIHANNTCPADFIWQNLMIEANVIHAAWESGVRRLLFLGSSCIYPRLAPQPMAEEALLTGALEPTNEPYAIAKIAGIKLCESFNRQYGTDYRSLMPTNLYGPGDNYHPQNSHVLPALLRRAHETKVAGAPELTIWGTGTPRREFLYVDDLANAALHIMDLAPEVLAAHSSPMSSHINIGSGEDHSIAEIAALVCETVGYTGRLVYDHTKPDGTPRKLMTSHRARALGWQPRVGLREGLARAYRDFLEHGVRTDAAGAERC
jgi:GDP-L-fucose synthase